jgi:KDO2-lipid IV(A) lauroyltransferase
MPYSVICRLGRVLGYLFYMIAARQRQRGIAQAMRGLEISYQEAERAVRQVFCNLGQTLMEVMYIPALTSEKISKYISIEGLDNLRLALQSGKGVVFLTAHIGNWEWMGAALSHAGFPITTIAKPQPNAHYTRILNEFRAMVGLEVFHSGTTDIVKAAKALKQGKVLGFLADEDGGANGVFVDFLGKKASTPIGPAIFAKRFGAAIVPAFTFHRPGGGHNVVIGHPFTYEGHNDPQQELYQNTARMTKFIEDAIKDHPEEWLWFRKRWNTPYEVHE